ncbi:glycosyltransferase family 4 protein [Paenibacillus sp. LHD-38]|uniref:glycosyltransferase family 4 protein n=1 Tax=Paenibacillus sp. LHD-38 TaxID=3072143 RepID=UPI00280FB1F4|nr:glycosyltransferase family 4 protein [Paenibacillus sp. LHD-38]MDQ8738348.1 glycosyltransferase family 4 protein [Paenibacillus sp. LHD-38]
MRKVLILASVASMIDQFNTSNILIFKQMNCEVHVVANFQFGSTTSKERVDEYKEHLISIGVIVHDILIDRNAISLSNINAYKEIHKLIDEMQFDIIHCHSPIGGVIARLAARKARHNNTKVVYTAHGFHFFNGASKKNWIIYYSIEKWLSKFTDCLITINEEDYQVASKNFKAKDLKLVNGIGIDLKKYHPPTVDEKSLLRKKYGYQENDFILMYAGELSYRKHQDLLINTVHIIADKIPNIKLLLAGKGEYLSNYEELVDELGLKSKIEFLGYRQDINNFMMLSDVAVSASRQEGLPVNIMEAMAIGLPTIVTDCRGNRDLIKHEKNGFVVDINDSSSFAYYIEKLFNSEELRRLFSERNKNIIENYSVEKINIVTSQIYSNYLKPIE